jgi:hypothetical protein
MSHNDNTPDRSGTGAGGSSSFGGRDEPEFGQRSEGAPSGPSYEPPRYGQGSAGDQYPAPQYGQDQQGQYGAPQHGQGHYGQGQQGYPPQPADQGQYPGQYGQNQYGQNQQGYPGQYPGQQGYPGQYPGQQGYPGQYPGQYDMGQYGAPARPAGTGLGIAALVLGILALLTCWLFGLGFVPGLVGLVLGIVALRRIGRTAGASKAVPIIGVVLSVLGILASIFFFFTLMSLMGEVFGPCSQYANDPAALEQCVNEQMGVNALEQ